MKYRIRGINGTYLRLWSAIGPCFGGSAEQAMLFDTRAKAVTSMSRHAFAFVGATVEGVKEKKP